MLRFESAKLKLEEKTANNGMPTRFSIYLLRGKAGGGGRGKKAATHDARVRRDRRRAGGPMRIDELTDDVLEHIVCKLFNPFVSGLGAAGIGSTSKTLRARLQVNALPWLRSQHAAAVALADKLGMTCDELCVATVDCFEAATGGRCGCR